MDPYTLHHLQSTFNWRMSFSNQPIDVFSELDKIDNSLMSLQEIWKRIDDNLKNLKQKAGKCIEMTIKLYNLAYCFLVDGDCPKALENINNALLRCPHTATYMLFKILNFKGLILYKLGTEKFQDSVWNVKLAFEIKNKQGIDHVIRWENNVEPELISMLTHLKSVNAQFLTPDSSINNNEIKDDSSNLIWDSRLTIREAKQFGRYLVANKKIPKGTVIIKELAFSVMINTANLKHKCTHCLKNVSEFSFWTCPDCCEVVYCNKICQKADKLHRFECCLAEHLRKTVHTDYHHIFSLMMRIGPAKLIEFAYQEHTKQNFPINKVKEALGRTNPVDDLKLFEIMSLLENHIGVIDRKRNIHLLIQAIELSTLVLIKNEQMLFSFNKERFKVLIKLAYESIHRLEINNFQLAKENEGEDRDVYGSAIVLCSSNFNHCCEPNTDWIFVEDKLIIKTLCDIHRDEEVTVGYGPRRPDSFSERQQKLLEYYHFSCQCWACREDVVTLKGILRCRSCNGPVYPNSIYFDTDNAGRETEARCLECNKVYNGTEMAAKRLEEVILNFIHETKMITNEQEIMIPQSIENLFAHLRDLMFPKGIEFLSFLYEMGQIHSKKFINCDRQNLLLFASEYNEIMKVNGKVIEDLIEKEGYESVEKEINVASFWIDKCQAIEPCRNKKTDHIKLLSQLKVHYNRLKDLKDKLLAKDNRIAYSD